MHAYECHFALDFLKNPCIHSRFSNDLKDIWDLLDIHRSQRKIHLLAFYKQIHKKWWHIRQNGIWINWEQGVKVNDQIYGDLFD